MALLLTKYQPNTSQDLVGNNTAKTKLKDFITNYKSQRKKVCIVHGPLGTGKTSLVYALAKELDYDILELNSSQTRNKDAISTFLSAALGQTSLFMRPKLILIDEADNTSGRKDRGGNAELAKILDKSTFPIICTANDILDKKIKPLKKKALLIPIDKPEHQEIVQFLTTICIKENIQYKDNALSALARSCDGDIRAALLDLQTLCHEPITLESVMTLDDRKRTQTILHALRIVFKSSSADTARNAFDDVDIDPDRLLLWLEYNVPKEYLQARSLDSAFHHLSRADIFKQRIRKWQHWRYLVYFFGLLSAGVSTAKDEKNPNNVEYKQSSRLLKMWMAKNKLAKKRDIAAKLAGQTHVSSKVAMQYMPHLRYNFKKTNSEHRQRLINELELNDEEVAWLRK
ncbi:hypothetical protein CL619_02930 [archaeon]|nr:hypothetical protein [archaeon]|tara:strand:- start:802 stop:2004 length:1203 start_codon:yes stop_codon:yes gene_type:complete